MKREVKYILTEDEVTCIGDIRTAKLNLERMADKIIREDKENKKYAEFMQDTAKELSYALGKLEIE